MPNAHRQDEPGAWHHVMNRGIARRTVFENEDDIRHFLSRIARLCHRRKIELHAYAILTTHFHLLVRSVTGELSKSMMWIEHEYVRRFNVQRERDGSLFRGRFTSKRVTSTSYWITLLRYIDRNPVAANVTTSATKYPYCSAFQFARRSAPPWLSCDGVGAVVGDEKGAFSPRDYERFVAESADASADDEWIVERRLALGNAATADDPDDFDNLIEIAPPAVLEWMKRKARLADGTRVGSILAAPEAIRKALLGVAPDSLSEKHRRACLAGLLRDFGGLLLHEIAARFGENRCKVSRWIQKHRDLLQSDPQYGEVAATAAQAAMRAAGGARGKSERKIPATVCAATVRAEK